MKIVKLQEEHEEQKERKGKKSLPRSLNHLSKVALAEKHRWNYELETRFKNT